MKNLVLLGFLLMLISCGTRDDSVRKIEISRDSIISRELFVLILSDIHLVDASLMVKRNKGQKPDHDLNFYYNGVFHKYHISKNRFQQNLDYYKQNPEEFTKIYDEVIELLSHRRRNEPNNH